MSVEKAVREKHAFRGRLLEFLSIASLLTNDEIEIALGRLVDMLEAAEDEHQKLDIRVKGTALKLYFDLRQAGVVEQDAKKWSGVVLQEIKEEIANKMHADAMREWKAQGHLEKWYKQPFWKRLLAPPPSGPSFWDIYYSITTDSLSVEEYFLTKLSLLTLVPKGSSEPEVTPEDVKTLVSN